MFYLDRVFKFTVLGGKGFYFIRPLALMLAYCFDPYVDQANLKDK